MPRRTAHFARVAPWIILVSGCVGGATNDRPRPEHTRNRPTTRFSAATAPAIPNDAAFREDEIGITTADPDAVLLAARSIIEPAYGPATYVRRSLPNGLVSHLLMSPGHHVSSDANDDQWLEIGMTSNPTTGVSAVEIRAMTRSKRRLLTSPHGGLWLFPPAIDNASKGENEHALLVALLQRLDDRSAHITTWSKAEGLR
jgi:hypothetical protein